MKGENAEWRISGGRDIGARRTCPGTLLLSFTLHIEFVREAAGKRVIHATTVEETRYAYAIDFGLTWTEPARTKHRQAIRNSVPGPGRAADISNATRWTDVQKHQDSF
jgi:hypothetical protein